MEKETEAIEDNEDDDDDEFLTTGEHGGNDEETDDHAEDIEEVPTELVYPKTTNRKFTLKNFHIPNMVHRDRLIEFVGLIPELEAHIRRA